MADRPTKKAWDKENTVLISAKLNRHTDADIIAAIEGASGSRAARIKDLIRKGIKSETQQ